MPTPTKKYKQQTSPEKQRVLDAHASGRDWRAVAAHNDIPKSTAYHLINTGRAVNKARGGAREKNTKVTPEILESLESYLNVNSDYTLLQMQEFIRRDHDVAVSLSTISRKLIGMLYTVKQVRIWYKLTKGI
jgi:transposase